MLTLIINNEENAALAGDQCLPEIARILRTLADRFERDGKGTYPLFDSNGNKVGLAVLTVAASHSATPRA